MSSALSAPGAALDFYTAPAATAPASIEGSTDSVLSAAACLHELRGDLHKWDGVSGPMFDEQSGSAAWPVVPRFDACLRG